MLPILSTIIVSGSISKSSIAILVLFCFINSFRISLRNNDLPPPLSPVINTKSPVLNPNLNQLNCYNNNDEIRMKTIHYLLIIILNYIK